MPVLNHHIPDIIRKIIRLESDQIILFHNMFHRNTLVDQSCHRKSIQWRTHNNTVILKCRILNILRHLSIITDNHTAYILTDRAQMVLMPVSQDHQVILLQKFPQLVRMGSPNNHLPLHKIPMRIPCYHSPINGIGNTPVLRSCI